MMSLRRWTTAVGAASIVGGLTLAPAAGASSNPNLVRCTGKLATEIPAGQTEVIPPNQGKQFGAVQCGKGIGAGLQKNSFKLHSSTGNLTGSFTAYFKNGTIKGKFKLTPQEGSLGNLNAPTFGAAGYAGTVNGLSGTGAFASATGTGTMTITSTDGIHFKLVEKL
jgi:hypothetical protein